MKKIAFFLLIAVSVVGMVSAQGGNDSQRENAVTINGTLQLEKGVIAVASGSSVYLVPSLTRYIGFIEDLKEGTSVSVEGYEYRNVLYPVKVTIAGKSYDFSSDGRGYGMMGSGWGNSGSSRNAGRFVCCY